MPLTVLLQVKVRVLVSSDIKPYKTHRVSLAMKLRITNAKIACLDINLAKQRMHLGVHITIDDPDQLEEIRKR